MYQQLVGTGVYKNDCVCACVCVKECVKNHDTWQIKSHGDVGRRCMSAKIYLGLSLIWNQEGVFLEKDSEEVDSELVGGSV